MKSITNFMKNLITLVLMLSISYFGYSQGTVKGVVKDSKDNPVLGATVMVANTANGTITAEDGSFSLNVEAGEQKIIASFVGYKSSTQAITVTDGGTSEVNFTLSEDVLGLDEIIVTGSFSERTQKEAPTSMTVLKSKTIITTCIQLTGGSFKKYSRYRC